MKCLLHSIVVALFFASCCTNAANGNEMTVTLDVDSVGSDYTANAQLLSKRIILRVMLEQHLPRNLIRHSLTSRPAQMKQS